MIPRPMLATAADVLPSGPEWTYEVKWIAGSIVATAFELRDERRF